MPLHHRSLLLLLCLTLAACFEANETASVSDQPPPLIDAAEKGDLPAISRLIGEESRVDVRDACLWTPLMKAALNGHVEAAKRLIGAGADVNLTDKGGYSALMLAASNNHAEVVDLLLAAGADPNQVEQTGGFTALIWAAQRGHAESVSRLLHSPADPAARDFSGMSAADWAAHNDHNSVLALLQAGAGPTPESKQTSKEVH
ncbi:MAG: ankyrin repeat domain-containing protein [Candidatus Thiodiazotropha sp.]|jgi:uncharacterized protein